MNQLTLFYTLISCAVLSIDRISKYYALLYDDKVHILNSYLACDVVINRGFSWSILHSSDTIIFFLVSSIVCLVTLFLFYYTFLRYKQGYNITGELLVCIGSLSNIIDRIWYKGVIDFIVFHYHNWFWPAFNVADFCIVLGVSILFYNQLYYE